MPIYEYVCMECESHFEELVRGDQVVACPDCAATNVSRQFSSFAVHGVAKPAAVGAKVALEREDGERMEVEISSVGGVSPDSPVGRALIGKAEGDEIEVEAPRGTWRARVVSVGRAS
jgi:putative FmdB family regulatory protein